MTRTFAEKGAVRTRCAVLAVGLFASVGACPRAHAEDAIARSFAAPATEMRPALRWWWPGNDVTNDGLKQELQAALEAGFGAVEIQAFRAGLWNVTGPAAARIDSYGTPGFFDNIKSAIDSASALGVLVDFTFGSGWPTGGSGVDPEHGMMELRAAAMTLHGPMHFHGKLPVPPDRESNPLEKIMPPPAGQAIPPEWQRRLAARRSVVAVIAARGTAPETMQRPTLPGSLFRGTTEVTRSGVLDPAGVRVLTAQAAQDGSLDWDVPPGDWQLVSFIAQASAQKVALGAGTGPQLVVDHFDQAAFDRYAAWLEKSGLAGLPGAAGHGLRSLFVDSFELTPETPWSADFLSAFRARRGYDLVPYLPAILLPAWMYPYGPQASRPLYELGDVGPRVLEDYHRTVSELMQARFFAPLRAFAHAHGLTLRLQAHGAPADLISTYGYADIPETEDLYNGPEPDFLSFARAAADIYGKKFASAESMILLGHAIDAPPALYKARADRFFISGIGQLVEHGMPYPYLQQQPGLGWAPFGALFGNDFDPANPLFDMLGPLNDYVARMQAVIRATHPIVPVALYEDMLFRHSVLPASEMREAPLSASLRGHGYTADALTLDGLLKSHADSKRLRTPGGTQYAAIVVNDAGSLDARAARALLLAQKAGVRVLFLGQIPRRAAGLRPQDDAAVRNDVASLVGTAPPATVENLPALLAKAGVASLITARSGTLPNFALRSDGKRIYALLVNPDDATREMDVTIPQHGAVSRWSAWTGTMTPAPVESGAGGELRASLPAYGSALYVIDPGAAPASAAAAAGEPQELATIGQGGWNVAARGFNAAGQSVDTKFSLSQLTDWRGISALGAFSGHAVYETSLQALPVAGHVLIDLGDVRGAARVTLNGCSAGAVMAPYRLDITTALHPGPNTLEITVGSTPLNGESNRSPDGLMRFGATQPAGLLGPVQLLRATGAMDGDTAALRCRHKQEGEGSSSFLKKRTKKLLTVGIRGAI